MKRKIYLFLVPLLATIFVCGCGMQGPLYETKDQPPATEEDTTQKSN